MYNPMINIGGCYAVRIHGQEDPWGKGVITLIIFKQIRSLYHPYYGDNETKTGENSYQPCYFICRFNEQAQKN